MQRITILGSTGSIGQNTLDVIAQHSDLFAVEALTANNNTALLLQQCLCFKPRYVVLMQEKIAVDFARQLKNHQLSTEVLWGEAALADVARSPGSDVIMSALVGAVGLLPTLAAVQANKKVLLANKETLVISGNIFIDALKKSTAELIPIDSEHSALLQCLPDEFRAGRDRCENLQSITITASGGPFRHLPLPEMERVSVEQALAHPNWKMGAKISIDSATMMNKGLEVIEAFWLFNLNLTEINVVIHPQSIVHSLVYYRDGSVLAQLGVADMRIPISYGLAWPKRISSGAATLDLVKATNLEFIPLDINRYPCFQLACDALQTGGTATCILNAANEVAVAKFLQGQIRFTQIAVMVKAALDSIEISPATSLDNILAADAMTRAFVEQKINELCPA